LGNLFDISPEAIFVTDGDGMIRDANRQAVERFGYTHEELIRMKFEEVLPERMRGRHPSHHENHHGDPGEHHMGTVMELFGLRTHRR
jgi:PAS domain S-box-containing protein